MRHHFKASFTAITLVGCALALNSGASASIIFDDFNSATGHFGNSPTFSSTTNVLNTAAGNVNGVSLTADAFEGAKAEDIKIQGGGQSVVSPSFPRIRFLSGSGTPANNASF